MAIGAAAYTEIIAATREAIATADLVDNVLTQHPVLDLFRENAKSLTGRKVIANIEGAENGSTQWTDDSGSFSTSVDADLIGVAEYDWTAPLVSSSRLRFKNIEMNQGREAVVDLVKTHLKAAEKAHAKTLAAALYDATPDSGAPLSLPVIVSDTATIGGINPASKAYWKSTVIESETTEPVKVAMRRLLNTIFVNGDGARPTHLIAGVDFYEEFEASLDDATRAMLTANPSTVDGRFRELRFDGLPVRLDPDAPANELYALNKNDFVFGYLADNWMKTMPAQQIPGTLDVVTPLASVLCVGVSQRRTHGRIVRVEPTV